MVFQAALSGTNYFKRPPLYHNRIKKRISPISGSPKPSTRELIIEPRAFLPPSSPRHRSIYFGKVILLLKTHCWLRSWFAAIFLSPLMFSLRFTAQPLKGHVNRYGPQN